MSWQIQQTRRFARCYKKLTQATLIADTDAALATVADNPDVGERKKGHLAQLWVNIAPVLWSFKPRIEPDGPGSSQ